jgi:nicotinate-nucleotide pyrophosphorylase (carboxylating)
MFACLLPLTFKEEVQTWLREDCPKTDVGGFVVGDKHESATLYCKTSTVLAGVPFADVCFEFYELSCKWHIEEGSFIDCSAGKVPVATVTGKVRNILLAERTALNILSRAGGVASGAKRAVDVKTKHKWHGFIAGTRKTTPGFGNVEKYALLVGGAATHRLDLSQMVMLKDNHIWSTGSITNAVKQARTAAGFSAKIEVLLMHGVVTVYLNCEANAIYIFRSSAKACKMH